MLGPEPDTGLFTARPCCPVCQNGAVTELYACPLTQSPVKDFIASHYARQGTLDWSLLHGAEYILCRCRRCELIYQKNVPGPRVLAHIYTEAISPGFLRQLEERRLTIDNFHRVAGELEIVFRLCGKHPAEVKFLDYGYGFGRWARVARAMGATVFATEIGDEKKAAAAAIGVQMISDDDIDRMRFDIVHAEQVFEHLPDPAGDFRRLARVTDGVLKIAVPQHGNIERLLQREGMASVSPISAVFDGRDLTRNEHSYIAIEPLEHLNTFVLRTMRWLAQANGMRVLSHARRASVSVNVTNAASLAKSVARTALMLSRSVAARDTGYYLLAPAGR